VTRELDVFVAHRLLTTDTDHSNVVVGVAHEAFLSAWAPLAQAIGANVSALRARRTVEQAAAAWNDEGRPPTRLWERGQLAAALADTGAHPRAREMVTDRVALSPTARTFLRAGIRRDRVRQCDPWVRAGEVELDPMDSADAVPVQCRQKSDRVWMAGGSCVRVGEAGLLEHVD
jgi:hypothetical protein